MKRIGLFVVALSLVALPAALTAQATPDGADADRRFAMRGHMTPAAHVLALGERLELTQDQVRSLEAIDSRYREVNEPLLRQLRDAMPTRQDRARQRRESAPEEHERMRKRMQDMRAEWEHLTPEERAERRAQMRERMAERRAEMTPEERERMAERRETMRAQREELRPVIEQLRENHREARNEVQAVLTEEQRATLHELHRERREAVRERRGDGSAGTPGARPGPGQAPRPS